MIEERYLFRLLCRGDGVYASFDGYHVVLDLEPPVLANLDEFREDLDDAAKRAIQEEPPPKGES